jgi:hypothetical protein
MAANGLAKKAEGGADAARMRRRTRPRAQRTTDPAHESPAVLLQAQLAQSLTDRSPIEARWSARRSLAFIGLANGVFWTALILAAKALI